MIDLSPMIAIASGVPVAILSSWLTVKFALRRFKSEKWFERRIEAYTKVIEALHLMKRCNERDINASLHGFEITEEARDELITAYRDASSDLRRLTDMGALIFSEDAVIVLDCLLKELDQTSNEESWWDHLDAVGAAISKALSQIRPIAKRDLSA